MGRLTENEAIEKIRRQICNEKGVQRYCRDNCMHGTEYCAYSMAIKALEKQIPKKPILFKKGFIELYSCPNCPTHEKYIQVYLKQKYCCECGQKLDWE